MGRAWWDSRHACRANSLEGWGQPAAVNALHTPRATPAFPAPATAKIALQPPAQLCRLPTVPAAVALQACSCCIVGLQLLHCTSLTTGVVHANQVCDEPIVVGWHAHQHVRDDYQVNNLRRTGSAERVGETAGVQSTLGPETCHTNSATCCHRPTPPAQPELLWLVSSSSAINKFSAPREKQASGFSTTKSQ